MSQTRRDQLFLVCLTLGAYYVSIFAPFNSLDDHSLITFLINKDGFSFSHYFFPTGTHSYYRPLVSLSYEFDKYAWGLTEPFMHLENILLHLLNVLLIYKLSTILVCKLSKTGQGLVPPIAVAALFALHPLNTEAVNWITARTDLMAGSFVLFALWALFAAMERDSLAWAIPGSLMITLGAMCKETALFVVPGIFWLIHATREGRVTFRMPYKRRWVLFAFFVLGALLYLLLRQSSQWHDQGASIASHTLTSVESTLIQQSDTQARPSVETQPVNGWQVTLHIAEQVVRTTGFYVKKMFWPWPLNFGINKVPDAYFWPGAVTFLLLMVFVCLRRVWSALLLSSYCLLSITLIVALTPVAWTSVAERYAYIPLAVALLALAAVDGRNVSLALGRWKPFILVVLIATMGASTLMRNFVWLDNLTLYQDTVNKSPDFVLAKTELARAFYEQGYVKKALALYETIEGPQSQLSSLNKVSVFIEAKEYGRAKEFLLDRMRQTPAYERLVLNYLLKINGLMLESSRDPDLNETLYREQLKWLDRLADISGDSFYRYWQGRIFLRLDERKMARIYFLEALKGLPKDSPYYAPAKKLSQEISH